jgi:uncharacterized protein YjbI with pentapeptide repeats
MVSFMTSVKNWIGTATDGGVGKLVSWSDLMASGLARTDISGNFLPPYDPGLVDYTPPPAPTNLTAAGAMTNILLEWDAPAYGNHAYTEIWAHSADTQGLSVLIGTSQGSLYAHPVGTAQTRYYWIRFVSKADVASAYNASAGVMGATSQDPAWLLSVLTGQLSTSQLVTALNTRINLIDDADSVPGSVSARVKTEQTARESADTALASDITTLSSTVGDNTAAISTEATTRATQTGELYAQYTVKVQTNGYVSGFGLASTLKDATPFSEFAIVADAFTIAPVNTDNTLADGSPFFHRTAATTINGVSVPAGTYMKSAYIHNASIVNAQIANLAVDDAKVANLSAAKVTFGEMSGDRITVNTLNADRINTTNLAAKLTTVGTAYINTANINDAAITTAKIGDAQVTNALIGSAAIQAANIGDLQVTNAKIANLAVNAAKIADATITTAKIGDAQVTTAKIGDAQITNAKIGNAAITNAKIGNAEVGTLSLAGQAVTIPVSAYTAASTSAGTTAVTVQTISITSTGAPILIVTSGTVGGGATANVNLLRNGVAIASASFTTPSVSDTPGAGTHTYTMTLQGDNNNAATMSGRLIALLETKR